MLCLALTLPLLPAAQAEAKKVVSAKVCGPSDCRTVKDRDALGALSEGGPPTNPPAEDTGWYEVRMTVEVDRGHHDTFPLAIVPSAGLMRGGDSAEGYTWMPVSNAAVRRFSAVTRGLVPFPASALEGVDGAGHPQVRVDEVVLPPDEAAPAGGASPLPWIAGGVALLAAALALIRHHRRRGGPAPRPAEG